jgi:predicted PolB exonuclease-like 3'-5' exonuclease
MELNIQHIDPKDQLSYLLQKLIAIIVYENTHTYQLLKKATMNKKALVILDDCKLVVYATNKNGYTLHIEKTITNHILNFKTKSHTLRQIIAGVKTIDKAIADEDFFISGSFEDTLNLYRLVVQLLLDATLQFRLRALWDEFLKTWEENKIPLTFSSYENQQASYDKWIQKIPVNILLIGI